jgi:long-subunit fatty acid transport protein
MGVQITPQISVGASVGLIYNENELITPYTFQSYPTVKGAKTLLHLNTTGFGVDGQAGVLYRPLTNLQFGVSYKSPSRVYSSGTATGDPYAQFGVSPGPLAFRYDAQVRSIFPQEVSGGASWGFLPKWRVAVQVDWINWADAFQTLPVSLKNGSNPTVNSVVGSSSFQDNIPLNWHNEAVYRVGLEYEVAENVALRAGYAYGGSPVPDSTLTPMTAAIMEHTLTAGVGYRLGCCQIDLAYQYDLPASRSVGASALASGEYAYSTTEVSVHWLALTLGFHF